MKVRTRVGDLGDTPWWVHGPVALCAVLATFCAYAGHRISGVVVAWMVLVSTLAFGVSLSRRVRADEVRPREERRQRAQGKHGGGWWLLLHVVMVVAGASPFLLWANTADGVGVMALVSVTAASIGLLFGTRSGLTIATASAAGSLAVAMTANLDGNPLWFGIGVPLWLAGATCVMLLVSCAMIARLGLAELASGPNVPAPFGAPATDKRGVGLFEPPGWPPLLAALGVTALCVLLAALLEPLFSPLTRRVGQAAADKLTEVAEGGPARDGTVFRSAAGSDRGGDVLGETNSFQIDQFGATSDREVLQVKFRNLSSVDPSAGDSVLLKGQSFDKWDGRKWVSTVITMRSVPEGAAVIGLGDVIREDAAIVRTHVKVMRGSTRLYFGPSRIAQVVVVGRGVVVRSDQSIVSTEPMGAGTEYDVFSTLAESGLDGSTLRTSLAPTSSEALFARDGVTGEHTNAKGLSARSLRLAETLGNGETTIEGVQRNIEQWLTSNTKYDYTAHHSSNKHTDIVDEFLFQNRAGWCEQIATSNVMLLRANGIPARLATGYLPSGRGPNGTLSVLGRDAHAWVEMYVPGHGWVQRDPTQQVPVAKLPPERSTTSLLSQMLTIAIVAAALAVCILLVRAVQRRRLRHVLSSDAVDVAIARFEKFGADRARRREPQQTLFEYGRALEDDLGANEGSPVSLQTIAQLVALLERERFSADSNGSGISRANGLLDDLELACPRTKRQVNAVTGSRTSV